MSWKKRRTIFKNYPLAQVLSQQTNPGIKYEYLLPTSLATSEEGSEVDYFSSGEDNLPLSNKLKAANSQTNTTSTTGRRKRKFAWKVIGKAFNCFSFFNGKISLVNLYSRNRDKCTNFLAGRNWCFFSLSTTGFTPCSKSCGGGAQQPIIRCARGGEPTRAYSPKKCAQLKKPVVNETLMKCNSQPCPAFWKLTEWSSCQCGELEEKTNRSREVKCVQELISGVVIQVNSGACIEDRPISSTPCECIKPGKTSKIEIHKHNRLQSSQSTQNDQKLSKNRTKQPKIKKSGSWLISEW